MSGDGHDLTEKLYRRVYRLKYLIAGLAFTFAGCALIVLAHTKFLRFLEPVATELGAVLLVFGVAGLAVDYRTRRDLRALVREETLNGVKQIVPDIRRETLASLAVDMDDLVRLVAPEVIDNIIEQGMAARARNRDVGRALYESLAPTLASPEYRSDARVDITLTPWSRGPTGGEGSMFVVTQRWEYDVAPPPRRQRFACLDSDAAAREAFDVLVRFEPTGSLDAASREAFQLVDYRVNGDRVPTGRTECDGGQVYSVEPLADVAAAKSCRVAYTHQFLVQRHGHVVYLTISKPTAGLAVDFTYHGCGIRHVNAHAFPDENGLRYSSPALPTSTVSLSTDALVLPGSGVTYIWTLDAELASPGAT